MRRRKKIYQEESGLDLTPMLDIVFIMLIFFIVTTSFVKESGIEVNRPNAETAERNEKGNILVAISENNEIYAVGGRVLNFVSLSDNFVEARKSVINKISELNWPGGFYRKDIGFKVINE